MSAHVQRPRTAEQSAMEHRGEGCRLDRHPGERGDRLGGRVGLLRGDPAELDGEIRGVARGVYALDPRDLAVGVDRDETVVGVKAMPRTVPSSSFSTASLTLEPNTARGASSGVASVTDMSTFMS